MVVLEVTPQPVARSISGSPQRCQRTRQVTSRVKLSTQKIERIGTNFYPTTEMLDRLGRWWPVTSSHLRSNGFTDFAWVLPSETIGSHIFTRGGGFAYRKSRDAGTLGLKWENGGPTKPVPGQELDHPQLREALKDKTEFTQQEWIGFGITNLRKDHFVKMGDNYFKPAAQTQGSVITVKPSFPS